MGPEEHDLQHTITIATDDEAGDEDLLAYAYPQVDGMLETVPVPGARTHPPGLRRAGLLRRVCLVAFGRAAGLPGGLVCLA